MGQRITAASGTASLGEALARPGLHPRPRRDHRARLVLDARGPGRRRDGRRCRDYHPGWAWSRPRSSGRQGSTPRGCCRALVEGRLSTLRGLPAGAPPRLPQYRSERDRDPAYGLGLMLSASDPLDHPAAPGHTGGGPGASGFACYARRGQWSWRWCGRTKEPQGWTLRRKRSRRAP
ncbi:hypothetical protein ACRAWD_31090 [Caulobacter segnis]